jgi:hypothetical protein
MFKNFFRVDIFFGTRQARAPKRETENQGQVPRETEAQIIPAAVKSRDEVKKKSIPAKPGGL